jgi:hypothetical protein
MVCRTVPSCTEAWDILAVERGISRLRTRMREPTGSRKPVQGGLRGLRGHGCVRGNHLSQELLVLSAASKAR